MQEAADAFASDILDLGNILIGIGTILMGIAALRGKPEPKDKNKKKKK